MKEDDIQSVAIIMGVLVIGYIAYEINQGINAPPGSNPRNPIATTGSIIGDLSQMISNFWNTPPWQGNPLTGQAYGVDPTAASGAAAGAIPESGAQ